jgi:hypothetical protein
MAGAGYKLFSTGDVLSASDVNTYLQQQTVMVFASAAARTTALASVLAEGMVTYLKDTDLVEIYTGAAWVSLDDPNAIQNSLLTAKGSIVTATGASTPSALAVGTANQVLTVDSSTATGLKWATPATASSKVVQIVTATTNTQTTNATTTYADTTLTATITPTSASNKVLVFVSQNGVAKTGGATLSYSIQLLRGSTAITFPSYVGGVATGATDVYGFSVSTAYLDSPATTSATTYKTQFKASSATYAVHVQYNNPDSTIVLMEVTP